MPQPSSDGQNSNTRPGLLQGKTIWITRSPDESNKKLSQPLKNHDAKVLELPLLSIHLIPPSPKALTLLTHSDWAVFTSKNGILAVIKSLSTLDTPLNIAVLGQHSAQTLPEAYQKATFTGKGTSATAFAHEFNQHLKGKGLSRQKIVWFCGNLANQTFANLLKQEGHDVHNITAYQTEPVAAQTLHNTLLNKPIDMITFTSPSAVEAYQNYLSQNPDFKTPLIACIGKTTQESALKRLKQVDIIPDTPSLENLAAAIINYYRSPYGDYPS